jgi:hypothetical protein
MPAEEAAASAEEAPAEAAEEAAAVPSEFGPQLQATPELLDCLYFKFSNKLLIC